MNTRRVLAVHDISCVGRCSLTVALPIISSVGLECSVLPTAVLSTQTGGFTGYTYRDLTEDIVPIEEHWGSLGLGFSAIYTGFLGSFEQIDLMKDLISRFPGATVYVDPVMADTCGFYPLFGPDFPAAMRTLCAMADVIKPNMTELCMMLGVEYRDGPYTREYISDMLERARSIGAKRIIVTGVSYRKGEVGAAYMDYETGEAGEVMRPEVPGFYHGTGDVFGSAVVGACESGLPLGEAVECAVDLTVGSINRTHAAGADLKYGVDFEPGLADYAMAVRSRGPPRLVKVETDDQIRVVESLALAIWPDTFRGMEPDEHIEYFVKTFQSFDAISDYIRNKGFTYWLLQCDGRSVGYVAYAPEGDCLKLSKFYLLKEYRGRGLSHIMMEKTLQAARELGLPKIGLETNRRNTGSIEVYKRYGFDIIRETDRELGEGHIYHDYILEKVL